MTPLAAYILLFIAVGVGFIFVHLVAGKLIRPNRPDAEKSTIYECGEPTIGSAWIQFDLRFYVVALLFVIFDVEVAFFFPWAEVFGKANAIAQMPVEKPANADAAWYRDYASKVLDLSAPETSSTTHKVEVARYKGYLAMDDDKLQALLHVQGQIRGRLALSTLFQKSVLDRTLSDADRETLKSGIESKEITNNEAPLLVKSAVHAVLRKVSTNQPLSSSDRELLTFARKRDASLIKEQELKLLEKASTHAGLQTAVTDKTLTAHERGILTAAKKSKEPTKEEQDVIEKDAEFTRRRKAADENALTEAERATLHTAYERLTLTAQERETLETAEQSRQVSNPDASKVRYDGLLKPGEYKKNRDDARALSRMALLEVLVFFGVIIVGFAYLWKRGDLAWVRSTAAERTPPENADIAV